MSVPSGGAIRIAVGDLHCSRSSEGAFRPLFEQASADADVLLLCGDLTDYGLPEEARLLARDVAAAARIPVVAVLGNHDFKAGRPDKVRGATRQIVSPASSATSSEPRRRLAQCRRSPHGHRATGSGVCTGARCPRRAKLWPSGGRYFLLPRKSQTRSITS